MPESLVPILRSKLHPPPVASGVIGRARLARLAPLVATTPVTLISAPAGYGKSTLASQWLTALDGRSCWLSLDASDSDLRQFIAYLIAALQTVVPDCCRGIMGVVAMPDLPDPDMLAATFSNELEVLDASIVVVLDDYHLISGDVVHEFVETLLRHPPTNLHLVIAARRDPPLSLQKLRASGRLTEVRMQQLSFSAEETADLVRSILGDRAGTAAISTLHDRTEGWPAGLRLALLAASTHASDDFVARLPSDTHAVRSYLLDEVLAQCSPALRIYLFSTAFLERFCASLAEAVVGVADDRASGLTGSEFIRRIRDAGFFCIALDDREKWMRYHHLFQAMLQEAAADELDPTQIIDLHRRAAQWFEAHGLLDEAIQSLSKAGDPGATAALIIRHRNSIMNNEQWYRLETWLRQLPQELVNSRPELLLLRARQLRSAGAREEVDRCVELAEALLATAEIDGATRNHLRGSIESLRCDQHYLMAEGHAAVDAARKALELLPPDGFAERGFAAIVLGAGLQMIGEFSNARATLLRTLSDPGSVAARNPTLESRILIALAFVYWMHGDLHALESVLEKIVDQADANDLREVLTVVRSFQAAIHYQRDELAAVHEVLGEMLASSAVASAEFQIQCFILAALAHQERGDSASAVNSIEAAKRLAIAARNMLQTAVVDAFAAELALRQGRMAEVRQWVDQFDPELLTPMYAPVAPALVHAKVLVFDEREHGARRAVSTLDELVEYLEHTHNNRFLAEALALRAILRDRHGDAAGAKNDLDSAVRLAQPGRFIRLFVDLGPSIVHLLGRLDLDEEGVRYVGEILAAFQQRTAGEDSALALPRDVIQVGLNTLSKREQQILQLLAQRLTNKEIAERLHLSPVTVKRHAANIYEKLGVHSRRQAVAKAEGLGLLGAPH